MKKINVLIVDDEFGIREGGKRALKKLKIDLPYIEDVYGLDIKTAESGDRWKGMSETAYLHENERDL